MSGFLVSSLFIHPVKSLKAQYVDRSKVDRFGFQFDRRFMLVDSSRKFVTQRKFPILAKLSARFDGEKLLVCGEALRERQLSFSVGDFSQESSVKVWADDVDALLLNDERTTVISELLGVNVSLAYMPGSSFRQVDREYFAANQAVSFADGFPFLLANEASLADLNRRLELPVEMGRFRPNIVFQGSEAFQEDEWKRISIGELEFAVVKPCSRCVMTGIDADGVRHKEPLATLSTYRKSEYGVCFGQNLVQLNEGVISVGDQLEVLE